MFEGLPRQGPGSDECTARAFHLIPDFPRDARVLDIGCGSGMQTLAFARLCPGCTITASDIHQPFLEDVEERAKAAGLSARITTVRTPMDDLPFPEEAFDLIWAEGSSFITGFGKALLHWKQFLKPEGYLAVSDCFRFTGTPTEEIREYFAEIYPELLHEREAETAILAAGYTLLGTFRLPDAAWWDQYYRPLQRKLEGMKREYEGNADVQKLVPAMENEIALFRNHSCEYGYSFFIMKKRGA